MKYFVPKFQRDYSWTDTEWEDLWTDMLDVISPEGEGAHYMGYLVLQSSNNKEFAIIDGQQRLTTLSIIILAILKNIKNISDKNIDSQDNILRHENLLGTFIGYLDPVSLRTEPKLRLNRNNDNFYQSYIVPGIKFPSRGLKLTESLLKKAFEWFDSHIQNHYGNLRDGAIFAQLISDLSDRLFFTVITVSDELNAYKVFETLNARGVKLSSTDLLKNYLFSIVSKEVNSESEFDHLDYQWEQVVGRLGSENLPDFLRTYWNSRYPFVRASELFKSVRKKVRSRTEVYELLQDLKNNTDLYVALSRPQDDFWSNSLQRQAIDEFKMFSIRQHNALLLAAFRKLSMEDFGRLLKICSVISFRYNVIGNQQASEQERVYAKVAEQINTEASISLNFILQLMRSLYIKDSAFEKDFSEKSFRTNLQRNKKIVRYILFNIENHCAGTALEFESARYNIEHVLPENPTNSWTQFNDRDFEQYVYRLGNMTLLNTVENRDLGNTEFNIKRPVYQQSNFTITQRIAQEYEEWTPKSIESHQQWMAKQAKTIWKISQME